MTTLSSVIMFYGIVIIKHVLSADHIRPLNVVDAKTFHSGNGIVGVASVAGITSDNGKVTTTGGVKFFPASETKKNKYSKIIQPWIFSRKTGDGFAMGAVQVYPGSVVTSATSYRSTNGNVGQIHPMMIWPALHNYYPQTTYSAKTRQDPVFSNNVFKDFDPLTPDFGDTWYHQTYDPFFNIWH